MINCYGGEPIPLKQPLLILKSCLMLRGFIISQHMEHWPQALKELGTMVVTGKLKHPQTVAEGMASAPEAFLGLLKGRTFGKQVVKLICPICPVSSSRPHRRARTAADRLRRRISVSASNGS